MCLNSFKLIMFLFYLSRTFWLEYFKYCHDFPSVKLQMRTSAWTSPACDLALFHFGPCGCWMCRFGPHNASSPSGSLAPGECQAQWGAAGLLPRGCVAALWSPSRNHIKAPDPEEPQATSGAQLWLTRWYKTSLLFKSCFCWYWDAALEYCCIVMEGKNWEYLWKLVKLRASRKIHVSFVLWVLF